MVATTGAAAAWKTHPQGPRPWSLQLCGRGGAKSHTSTAPPHIVFELQQQCPPTQREEGKPAPVGIGRARDGQAARRHQLSSRDRPRHVPAPPREPTARAAITIVPSIGSGRAAGLASAGGARTRRTNGDRDVRGAPGRGWYPPTSVGREWSAPTRQPTARCRWVGRWRAPRQSLAVPGGMSAREQLVLF